MMIISAIWQRSSIPSLVLFIALLCGVVATGTASAQGTGIVEVVVVDAMSAGPVPFVSVTLYGANARVGLTAANGRVQFDGLVAGTYTISASRTGYNPARIGPIALADGAVVTISLAKPLQRIGSSVSTVPPPPPTTVTDSDPHTSLAGNTQALLGALSGIDLVPFANGSVSAQQFGNAAQTGIRIDDLRVGLPGSPLDLRALPLGLFDTATAESAASKGDLAGSVRLGLPEPTLRTLLGVKVLVSAPSTGIAVSARGTSGNLGYAFTEAMSAARDQLQGQRFLDQTGTSYEHAAGTNARGFAAKARVPLSLSNVLSATALVTDAVSDDSCFILANVPCGFGRGAQTHQGVAVFGIRDVATVGSVGVAAGFESSLWRFAVERPQLSFLGVPQRVSGATGVRADSTEITLQAPNIGHHSTALAAYGVNVTVPPSLNGSDLPALGSHRYGTLTLSDRIRLSQRDVVTLDGSLYGTDLLGSAGGSVTFSRTFSRGSRLSARYAANVLGFPETLSEGFGAPSDAQYDCASGTVLARGPAKAAVALPRLTELSASYELGRRSFDAAVEAYHRVEFDTPVTAAVPAAGTADDVYLALLQNAWRSPLICGSGSPSVLLSVPVIADAVVNEGVRTTVRWRAGRRVQLIGTAATTHAYVRSLGAFADSRAFVLRGRQLPGVPLSSASLTAAYSLSPHATAVGAVKLVGGNDPSGRGGAAVVSVGGVLESRRGTIVVAESNVFGTGAVPFAAFREPSHIWAGGVPLRTLQYPLPPRTLSVSYRTSIGSAAPRISEPDTLLGQTESSAFELIPFSDAAPANPFSLASDNPECGPERAAVARRIFDAAARYAAGSAHGNVPGPDGSVFAFRERPHETVLIGSPKRTVVAALFACGKVHGGGSADVDRLQLYSPTAAEQNTYDLLYTPRAGLYVAAHVSAGEQRISLRRLDDRPRGGAFGVTGSCPPERVAAARALLGELRDAFSTEPPSTAPSFRIVKHSGSASTWYEIRANDLAVVGTIVSCADIAGAAAYELVRRGAGGAEAPALNYAEAFGLYVVQ
jgi:hypothetical protein